MNWNKVGLYVQIIKMVFDTDKMLLLGGFVLLQVAYAGTRTTCNYVDNGEQKTKQCEHGCCGNDPNDQHCCGPNDNDNQRLLVIVGASVGGGLILLALLILVVFCCINKKNNAGNKVHTDTTGGVEMIQVPRMRGMTPPPAYSYNSPSIVTGGAPHTGGTQQANSGQGEETPTNNQPGGNTNVAPAFHPPPRHSSLQKKPLDGNNI